MYEDNPEDVCCEVYPGLFVGSLRSLGYLERLGITHVLSAVNFPVTRDLSGLKAALRIPLQDDESEALLPHLPAAINFISRALTGHPLVAEPASRSMVGCSDEADEGEGGDSAAGAASGAAAAEAQQPSSSSGAATADAGAGAGAGGEARVGGGRVLVHCQAGMSRSVSLVAAYIMKVKGCDVYEALRGMRAVGWTRADPNEGYMAQLGLFGDMRCSLDLDHPVYRMWRLEQVGKRWEDSGYVDASEFAQLPEEGGKKQATSAPSSSQTAYRCRKCRKLVATAEHVLPLEAAMGHKAFRERKRVRDAGPPPPKQEGDEAASGSSIFLEPMAWMTDWIVGENSGKLYCPGCKARLGSFNWSGITNEKGQWVTPAFQLHMARLDIIQPIPAGLLPQVRRPLLSPTAATPAFGPRAVPVAKGPAAAGAAAAAGTPTAASQQPGEAQASRQPGQGQAQAQQEAASSSSRSSCKTAWFTTLVLDCDGVLVDTERSSCEALRRAILETTGFDIPHSFPEDYTPVFGMCVRGCLEYYAATYPEGSSWGGPGGVESLVAPTVAAKERHYHQLTDEAGIVAFEGAAELIRSARALGMAVGVGSSGAPEKIARNLGTSGLAPLLEPHFIVSAAHVSRGKPAPDVYQEALRRLGCTDPARALVIEDAVNGLKAARAAGTFAVAVTNSLPADMLAQHADLVVTHLSQLDLATLVPSQAKA